MNIKLLLFCLVSCFSTLVYSQSQKQYIFFLHNKFIEDHALHEKHPQYGIAQYKEIIEKLKDKNTIVISEKRKPNTDIKAYALKVTYLIDSLSQKGIPINAISVIGTSQGGYIAQYVSYYMKNPDLRFVIIGASFNNDSLNKDDHFRLYGKILSIKEKSDSDSVLLSTQKRLKNSKLSHFKEIELNTGLNHGFLFKALDSWISPAKKWVTK